MRSAGAAQPCPRSPLGALPPFLCSSSCLLPMLRLASIVFVPHHAKPAGLRFTLGRQWEVGSTGVLTRDGPGGLAVPRQVAEMKRATHERLLVVGVRPARRDVSAEHLQRSRYHRCSTAPIKTGRA